MQGATWGGCRSLYEGKAVFAPKGMNKILHAIHMPKAEELEGRGMALHVRREVFDMMLVDVYATVGNREVMHVRRTEKLWNWVRRVAESSKRRTRIRTCTDANGHVGSVECLHVVQCPEIQNVFLQAKFNNTLG